MLRDFSQINHNCGHTVNFLQTKHNCGHTRKTLLVFVCRRIVLVGLLVYGREEAPRAFPKTKHNCSHTCYFLANETYLHSQCFKKQDTATFVVYFCRRIFWLVYACLECQHGAVREEVLFKACSRDISKRSKTIAKSTLRAVSTDPTITTAS